MALGDILAAIRDESEGEIAAITEEANRRTAEVLERARREAAAIEDRATHARDGEGGKAADRIVNQARLNADRLLREAREAVFGEALEAAAARLASIRTDPEYRDLLDRLIEECREALPIGSVLRIAPPDIDLVADVLRTQAAAGELSVEPVLETSGGLELWATDGRRVTNTLESRLQKAEPHLRTLAGQVIPELRSTPS